MKRSFLPLIIFAVVVVGCAILITYYTDWQAWVAKETGSRNEPGLAPNYNYWSGFGSVFPWSMGTLGGLVTIAYQQAKKANCHTHKCWRLGAYPAGDYRVCKKHHLQITGEHPTVAHIRRHHRLHLQAKQTLAKSGPEQPVD